MKKYLIFFIATTIVAITGCYKDLGNYDLKAINEVSLHGSLGDTIKIMQFDTLKLQGIVEQTIPAIENNLKYRWNAYETPNAKGNFEFGNEKNLNVPIGLKPGNYTLLFTVTDLETDVSFFKEFYLQVSSTLSEGWLVLEDKTDGSQDVAIINNQGGIIHDLYRNANNNELLPQNSYKVQVLNGITEQHVFAFSKNDAVQVDYSSFEKINSFKDWFYEPFNNVFNIESFSYTRFGVGAFLVNNGNVYVNTDMASTRIKLGAPILGDWKISKFTFPLNALNQIYFYDDKNQRFLYHQDGKISTLTSQAGSAFDLNNVGKKLIYGGPSSGDYYNCLMKSNTSDEFFIYRLNVTGAIKAAEVHEILDAPEIERATMFASSGLYLHLYYAVDNKIYLLDIPAKTARLVYAFPVGTEISTIRLKQASSLLVFYPDNNKTLAVATWNNNEGKLYTFSIGNTGDFINDSYTKEYPGFGKIKSIDYKNRK